MVRILVGLIAVINLTLALPVRAADVESVKAEIRMIAEKVEEGDYAGALDSARLLESWLMEFIAEDITAVFTDFLDWTKNLGESQAMGQAMFGGGITSTCTYTSPDGSDEVEVTILGNSPMFGMVSGMLSNTFMLSASGGSVIRLPTSGKKAIVKTEGSGVEMRVEVMVPCEGNTLVTSKGKNKETTVKCTDNLAFDTLEKVVQAQ